MAASRYLKGVNALMLFAGFAAILRDAVLRTAPQDEVGGCFRFSTIGFMESIR